MNEPLVALCTRCIEALHMEGLPKIPLVRAQACESCGDDGLHLFESMPVFEKPADLCRTRGFHVALLLAGACRTCGARSPIRLVPKMSSGTLATPVGQLTVAEASKKKAKSH